MSRPEPRVTDAELSNWERTGMLTDCALDLRDERAYSRKLETELAEANEKIVRLLSTKPGTDEWGGS